MDIEKNVSDAIFNTVINVEGKTKDNVRARTCLKLYCRRKELELKELANRKIVKQRRNLPLPWAKKSCLSRVKDLTTSNNYSSYLAKCVDVDKARISGLKSHDCHVFMQLHLVYYLNKYGGLLLNLAISLEICAPQCCKRINLPQWKEYSCDLVQLERIFPPSFFNSMDNLPMRMAYEATLGGLIQYHWMHPFER